MSTYRPFKRAAKSDVHQVADHVVRPLAPVERRDAACASTNRATGFTLVELMIAVAVVAILAIIAYPSYQAQIRKGHRAAAQSYLMDLAQREQQYLLDARAYTGTLADLGYTKDPDEVSPWYKVTINVGATPPSFTITADALGSQAADAPTLSIDNVGTTYPADKW